MLRASDTATLQGLELGVADLDAAKQLVGRVLELPSGRQDGTGGARFALAGRWLVLQQAAVDAADCLHWHCTDLSRQQALLGQLGIDVADETSATSDRRLQVSSVDTGACAAAWTDGPPASDTKAVPALRAVVLRARAPERVAAHWAQMLSAPVGRNSLGLPRLSIDGIDLSFTFAEEGVGGVGELMLAVDAPDAVRQRADAAGMTRNGDALSLAGLTIRLCKLPS